jgi:hypothetical protein
MPRANFDDTLHLPDPQKVEQAREANEEVPGPPAGGPIPDGEELSWVYVWLIQNGPDGKAAAAYGEVEHAAFQGRWDTPTEMAHKSDPFTPGHPVLATAMAWVKDLTGGGKDVYWWSEAVTIEPHNSSAA